MATDLKYQRVYEKGIVSSRKLKRKIMKENLTIGKTMKAVRIKRMYRQDAMAKKLNICQGTLSKIENNELMPTMETIMHLRKNFSFNVNSFIDNCPLAYPFR